MYLGLIMELLTTPGACVENDDGSITISPERRKRMFVPIETISADLVNDARACMGLPTKGEN